MDTLPSLPPNAIPFELHHLADADTAEEFTRAAELSVLANRLADDSGRYRSGAEAGLLWDRHRDVIRQMESPVSTLSETAQAQLSDANSVLYAADGFSMSERFVIYQETRGIYQELVIAGASNAEVESAFQDWLTVGHKLAVEHALAVKATLSSTSSRVVAADDVARIEIALGSLAGHVPYAPTMFSPLSAASPENWTVAEVQFGALEATIRDSESRREWATYRARKNGHVRFRFAVVDLIRPWYTDSLYTADDWRLGGDKEPVADGLGRSGQLPTYYSKLYMAEVLDIRHERRASRSVRKLDARSPALRPAALMRPIARPANVGTMATISGIRPTMASVRPPGLRYEVLGRPGKVSKVEMLTSALATQKLQYVLTHVANVSTAPPSDSNPAASTWLVGLGRTNLPECPKPNPTYRWA